MATIRLSQASESRPGARWQLATGNGIQCPSFLLRELHWHRRRVGACPYRQDIGVGLMTFSQGSAVLVRGLPGAAACAAPNWPWNLATNPPVDQLGSTGH